MRCLFGVFLLTISLMCASCFEVVEEITLKDDGSGHITMTVNLSQSKTKINSIMRMETINDYKVPTKSEITDNINKMIAEIKSVKGVSKVKHNADFTDYILTVSCDFSNVDDLNNVVKHFSSISGAQPTVDLKQFDYDKDRKVFKRSYTMNLSQEVDRVKAEDRQVLDGATVTTIYRFESPVKNVENPHAKVAGNKKAVMLRVGVNDLIKDKKNIKNTISLNH